MAEYITKRAMPGSAEALFTWHASDGAFIRLLPPWKRISLIHRDSGLAVGSEVHFKMHTGPLSFVWIARHTECDPPHMFVDEQLQGPFAYWSHHHRMIPVNASHSELEEHITFRTPFGIGESLVHDALERLFQYRHTLTFHDLKVQQALPSATMRIAITGASGMVGSALCAFLQTAGHQVLPIVRHPPGPGEIEWDPIQGTIDSNQLEGVDAVINLAGENIGSGRWTAAKKARIYESRVKGTALLVKTLNCLNKPPQVFISASAVGYYGSNTNEAAAAGSGFLASVCADWEAEARRFTLGRCVIPRIGVILSASGGALAKMTLPFLMGAGGVIGSGRQWVSWIALDDLVYLLYRLLIDTRFSGAVNACSPHPVTNYELTKSLGRVLRRPTIAPLPRALARIAFGEMADATLLSSCAAAPEALLTANHTFCYPNIEDALRHTLGRAQPQR